MKTLVGSKVTSGEIDRDWANCVKCDSKHKLFALEPVSFIESYVKILEY